MEMVISNHFLCKDLESSSNWGGQAFISMDGFFRSQEPELCFNIGVLHKDLVNWENRAPKDWQVASPLVM